MKLRHLFSAALLLTAATAAQQATSADITASDLKTHITYLASDALKGRMTGSPEQRLAADYIAAAFRASGLQPLFGDSYFQEFPVIKDVQPDAGCRISFIVSGKQKPITAADFKVFPFSGEAAYTGEVVFVGYGISAPKLQYDDYAGINVTGKLVVALRYNPENDNPHTPFEEYSSFRVKAGTAREKGARGIIFINGPMQAGDKDEFPMMKYDRAGGYKELGVFFMARSAALELFADQDKGLDELQQQLNSKKNASFTLAGVSAEFTTKMNEERGIGINVGAVLTGSDPQLQQQYLVAGAHFDHLGMGGDGSLYRGKDEQIHNGADDNASGTAALLELAEYFGKKLHGKTRRSIVFTAFSGEEMGLLGSNYLVNNFPKPIDSAVMMLNMDMVGRLNAERSLIVYGTGTSSVWKKLMELVNTGNLKLSYNPEGYGPSDHSSFYAKKIPVLFLFTGTHADYHRPSDDADKINFEGEALVAEFGMRLLAGVDASDSRPDYINVPRKEGEKTGGWKVYVGTVPDYAYTGEGLKITGVNEGSPAKKAGLTGGDVILKFGDKKIGNIYDYVAALKDHVPGDIVELIVKRGEEQLTLSLELGAR